jgi:hypothetical protein
MKKLLLLMMVSCILYYHGNAQSTCTQTLRSARATYDQGRLQELPSLLEGCLRSGFSTQEKVEAYKLLTLAYIYLEEPDKADQTMLAILNTDHYFEVNYSTDPAEFIALYKTFRTKPIYRVGGKIGAVATMPNVVEAVKANEGDSKYIAKIGVQLHFVFEIPLSDRLTFNPEIGFMQRNFGYENTTNFIDTTFSTVATEKQNWISLPLNVQYQFQTQKFKPFVALGFQTDYLLGSNFTGSRTRKGYQFIEEKSFALSTQREKLNMSIVAAAGAHFKLGGGLVITEVRVLYGLKNVNSNTTAFAIDSNLPFQYGYADSVFKLNSISLTIGYVYNIFNPKKLHKRK